MDQWLLEVKPGPQNEICEITGGLLGTGHLDCHPVSNQCKELHLKILTQPEKKTVHVLAC